MTARKLVSEALGTGFLVAAVVGSGIMADKLTDDVALALLANTIATGAALIMLITTFGAVSGAQFNPVVTLVFALRREMPASLAMAYVVAQCAGGIAGKLLTHAMFDLPVWQTATTVRSGQGQWLSEAVASFGLIMAILGTIHARATVATSVAAYIIAAYWFTASTSFANPAVALARSLTNSFAGIRPVDLPALWTAEIVGAVLAATLGTWLFRPGNQPTSET